MIMNNCTLNINLFLIKIRKNAYFMFKFKPIFYDFANFLRKLIIFKTFVLIINNYMQCLYRNHN